MLKSWTHVTLPLLAENIWGHFWKHTVEKSQTNATNVTLHLLGHAIWGHTCCTKIPKNTGILFSKIPVSVFESNPGIPVFSGIPQGPDGEKRRQIFKAMVLPDKDAQVITCLFFHHKVSEPRKTGYRRFHFLCFTIFTGTDGFRTIFPLQVLIDFWAKYSLLECAS